MRRSVLLSLAAAAAAAAIVPAASGSSQPGVAQFTAPSRADYPPVSAVHNQKYVNEPATVYAKDGKRYVAYQRDSQLSYTTDGGRSWHYVGGANSHQDLLARNIDNCSNLSDVGDVDLAADRAGRVYFADLQITAGGPGDAGIEPVVARSDDGFRTWQGTCAGHQPASVDREWLAAWTPPGHDADHSDVYLSYHDFGPNTIWVNASHDGGRTWSQPVDVISSLGSVADSFCDTVPAGTAVDPVRGWVYVAWTAGDEAVDNAATGCNYTQGTVFSNLYVAVSKDKGQTWTPTQAVSGPDTTSDYPADMSEIFASLTVDRRGGVYVAYPAYLSGRFGAYAAYSPPADAAGMLHFRRPVEVTAPGVNTAYFTRIVAGDPGRVDVLYLGSPTRNVVVTPENKAAYTGAPGQPNCAPEVTDPGNHGARFLGKPCQLPPTARWYLYLAQSLDLTGDSPRVTNVRLRNDAVHTGDICTLGIFCLGGDNRDLADTYDVKIDDTGGAQVAYTYETPDGSRTQVDFQCQTGGPGLYAGTSVRTCRG